jgi:pimeloyl-ACP methyl ester carboxylesterase
MGLDRSGGDFNPFLRIDDLDPPGEPVATEEELRHYVEVFSRTGFRGGINWYRNIDANAEAHPEVGNRPLELPALMLCAEWDPALPPSLAAGMSSTCADLELHTVPGAGHWLQQECPEQVNGLLIDWLTRRFPDAG